MKKLCLIFAISLLPLSGFCQFIGDTVIVYVENRVEIKVAVPDYKNIKTLDSVVFALNELKRNMPVLENQISAKTADLIKYSVGGSLTVEPGDPKIIYMNKKGEFSNTGFRDKAIISGERYKIIITTTDISKISELQLSKCFEKAIDKFPEKSPLSKSLYYECTNEGTVELKQKTNRMEFLELNLGTGVGLIKSSWVADLSFGLSLGLNYKGIHRAPYVSTNMIFDFDTESKLNINTFLNLGYQWEIRNKSEKRDFIGVELGYLISKQGDLFGKNTFKLGVNWSPAKFITVSPQLYITDNFKTAYPAIRIGFGI